MTLLTAIEISIFIICNIVYLNGGKCGKGNYLYVRQSGDSDSGESVIPPVEIQIGVSTSGDSDQSFPPVETAIAALK